MLGYQGLVNLIKFTFKYTIVLCVLSGCATQETVKEGYGNDLSGNVKIYTVKSGDTLYAIGFRSGHGYKKLAAWNKIAPPYKILVGQKIKLYNPELRLKTQKVSGKKSSATAKKRASSQKKKGKSTTNKKKLKLYWQWPVKGRILKTYSQTAKKGIDIQVRPGQKVLAAAGGKVVYSGNGLKGYGNLLIIKHSDLYLSAYAHNKRLLVKEGQYVKKGQTIAEVGRNVKQQYVLHFEIRKNGKPVNPVNYLPK